VWLKNNIDQIIRTIIALLIGAIPAMSGYQMSTDSLLFEIIVFSCLLIWIINQVFIINKHQLLIIKTKVYIFFGLMVIIIALQTIPLPAEIIQFLSPETLSNKLPLCQLPSLSNHSSCLENKWSLTYSLNKTIMVSMTWISCMILFFLILHTFQTKTHLNYLMGAFVIGGLIETFFGHTPQFWWWADHQTTRGIYDGLSVKVKGSYIISDYYPEYMVMIIPLVLGLIMSRSTLSSGLSRTESMIKWFRSYINRLLSTKINGEMLFLWFCLGIILFRFYFSATHGEMVSLCFAILWLAILCLTQKQLRQFAFICLCLWITLIMVIPSVGRYRQADNLSAPKNNLSIQEDYTISLSSFIQDYFFWGVGLGNGESIALRYPPTNKTLCKTTSNNELSWNHTLYQFLIEMGIIGTTLVLSCMGIFYVSMLRLWRARNSIFSVGIGAGILSSIAGLIWFASFTKTIKGVTIPIMLTGLTACLFLSLHIKQRYRRTPFFYRTYTIPLTTQRKIVICVFVSILWIMSCYICLSQMIAERLSKRLYANIHIVESLIPIDQIKKAIQYNPKRDDYYYYIARYYISHNDYKSAVFYLEHALLNNPVRSIYWYDLGFVYAHMDQDSFTYLHTYIPLAQHCFDRAIQCEPSNITIGFDVACFWVKCSRMNSENEPKGIQTFQKYFQTVLELQPNYWKKAVDCVWEYYPDDSIISGIVPNDNKTLLKKVLRSVVSKTLQTEDKK